MTLPSTSLANTTLAEDLANLPERGAPALSDCVWHGSRPGNSPYTIIFHPTALLEVKEHGLSDTYVELGGVLLGHAYQCNGETIVEIMAALPAMSNDNSPVHFTFNADAWATIHQERAIYHPDLAIVGWFHTHPDLGVFYSSDDVVVHSVFRMPWQVGLVVDPVREEVALFGWVADEVSVLPGFYELLAEPDRSVLPWRVIKTSVWTRDYMPSQTTEYLPKPMLPTLPPVSGWYGFVSGGLAVFTLLILVLTVVLPLQNKARALEVVTVPLLHERMAVAMAAGLADCPDGRLQIFSPLAGSTVPAGADVSIIGAANLATAYRYQLHMRPEGVDEWTQVDQRIRDNALGELFVWDTVGVPAGAYELRLRAIDRDLMIITTASSCTVQINVK